MVEIVQKGNPVLRKKAEEVPVTSIASPKIKKIIKDMASALYSQDDGVAIAAPQIAQSVRIFLVAAKVFDEDFARGKKVNIKENSIDKSHKDMVFINPTFKKISKDRKLMAEGCLSVRPLYGKVRRATKATVEAYDENGKKFVKSASGLLAHIFQHEIDHLDGVLFIDKARDIHESTPEKEYN